MSAPKAILELDEDGPFTGAGPHDINTHYDASPSTRFSITCKWIVKDALTSNLYFVGTCEVMKIDNTTVMLEEFKQILPNVNDLANPWSGTVSAVALIVDNALVGRLTIPAGYTVEVSFKNDGLTT